MIAVESARTILPLPDFGRLLVRWRACNLPKAVNPGMDHPRDRFSLIYEKEAVRCSPVSYLTVAPCTLSSNLAPGVLLSIWAIRNTHLELAVYLDDSFEWVVDHHARPGLSSIAKSWQTLSKWPCLISAEL